MMVSSAAAAAVHFAGQKFRVFAPGKVILLGEHAVVHYKKAVAVSVGLYTILDVDFAPEDDFVTIKFPGIAIDHKIPVQDLKDLKVKLGPNYNFQVINSKEPIPLNDDDKLIIQEYVKENITFAPPFPPQLAKAQTQAMEAFLGLYLAIYDELIPIKFEVQTDLPIAAGLGSSASFGVALVGGMLLSSGKISVNPSKDNLTLVNRWAFLSERFVHGSPSGIDNFVETFGGAVLFQRMENGPGELTEAIDCPDIRVLLVDTKVIRSTSDLVGKVTKLKEDSIEVWQKCMDNIGQLVEDAVQEIKEKRMVQPNLFDENHRLLQTLGVSHPLLDMVVEIGKSFGFSGKLTGAGGGGCAFIFIPPDHNEETSSALRDLKTTLTDKGFVYWDTKLGCPGFHAQFSG